MANEETVPGAQRARGLNGRRADRLPVRFPFETRQGIVKTQDGSLYVRDQRTGSLRRARPKAKGKAARRAEREARRLARGNPR